MDVRVVTSVSLPSGITTAWLSRVLERYARTLRLPASAALSVACVGDRRMKKLHGQYSGEATVTDVLSFPAAEAYGVQWPRGSSQELGELVLCMPQILRQAKRAQVSVHSECARMLAHGLLHLLGHDHAKKADAQKMYALQEELVYTIK